MPDVFDRIASRHSRTAAPVTRLTMRPKRHLAEVTAPEQPVGPLGADPGTDGSEAGLPTQEPSRGELRPRRSAPHGDAMPPTTTPGQDRGDGEVRDAAGPPSGDRLPAAPPAPPGRADRPATAPRRRASSSPGTAASQHAPGEPSLGDETAHGASPPAVPQPTAGPQPATGRQPTTGPRPTTVTAAPALPPPRGSPRQPTGPTRTVEPEELLREHLAPALVARGTVSAPAVERLAAVGLQAVEVPAGGDVHVHIGRVELRQPGPLPRPSPEPPRADDRAGSGRVDHADYLARQRRRWS